MRGGGSGGAGGGERALAAALARTKDERRAHAAKWEAYLSDLARLDAHGFEVAVPGAPDGIADTTAARADAVRVARAAAVIATDDATRADAAAAIESQHRGEYGRIEEARAAAAETAAAKKLAAARAETQALFAEEAAAEAASNARDKLESFGPLMLAEGTAAEVSPGASASMPG